MILKIITFVIVFLFLSIIVIFLYKGSIIYDLLILSNYNDIFKKTNKDVESLLNLKNNSLTIANENIFYSTDLYIYFDSVLQNIYVNNLFNLNLNQDISKLILIFKNFKELT